MFVFSFTQDAAAAAEIRILLYGRKAPSKLPSSRWNLAADFLPEYPLRTSSTFYLKIEVLEPCSCNKVVWWSKIEINETFWWCCCLGLLRIFSSNSFTIFYKQWTIIWQTIAKPFSQYWSHICLAKKKLLEKRFIKVSHAITETSFIHVVFYYHSLCICKTIVYSETVQKDW